MADVPAAPAPAPVPPPAPATTKPQYLVVFMPWAGIGKELKIGPVTVWDYYGYADEKIKDPAIREQLDKNLACYVGKDGEPTRAMTIMTHGAADFRKLEPNEREDIQRAADILTFSAIYSNAESLIRFNRWDDAPPSSDRYQYYLQNFTLGNKYMSVRAGVSTDIWPLADLRFMQPWALGGSRARPDEDLIEALARVLDPAFPDADRRRIMRALEWYRLSHSQADNVHTLMKVIMLSIAFETLLQVGRVREKAKFIRSQIEAKFNYNRCITDVRQEKSPPIRNKPRIEIPVTLTKAAWWAQDFYSIRSDIAHGDHIDPARLIFEVPFSKKKLSQLDVAAVVFGELLLWELESKNLCGQKVRDLAAMLQALGKPEIPVADYVPGATRMQYNFDDVHEMLGWTMPHESKKIRKDDDEDD